VNVLIAGCGYVGSALAAELVGSGHRVWGMRRSAGELPRGVVPVVADLTRPETLDALDDSIDHLVYAASPRDRSERAYEDAYVRGLENVLAVLERRASLKRVVLTSSTAVYGQDGGEEVDESSPAEPTRFAGRALLRGEDMLRGRAFEGVALRLAGIYGPGRTWLVRRVANGEARVEPSGSPPRYGNRIHRDDCAGAIAHLLAAPRVEPIYLGVDDDPAPLADVYRFVAGLLGVDPPPVGEPDENRGGNKRCRNRRLRASGYALRVPSYREGYGPIVRAYLEDRARASRG
jgi:nucleoside-diphosphate-sugar epimerase